MNTQDAGLRVAVITGGHGFDVPGFHCLFRRLAGVDAYVQTMEDFAGSPQVTRDTYEVALFYHMLLETPSTEGGAAVARLRETGQGIVAMHHTLLAYPKWPVWRELTGIDPTWQSYHHDQHIRVQVARTDHPITSGLSDFELTDETYLMGEPDAGSQILLTTQQPNSLKALAWTRSFGRARVFSLVSGHDVQAWSSTGFADVLGRGIHWAAGRD